MEIITNVKEILLLKLSVNLDIEFEEFVSENVEEMNYDDSEESNMHILRIFKKVCKTESVASLLSYIISDNMEMWKGFSKSDDVIIKKWTHRISPRYIECSSLLEHENKLYEICNCVDLKTEEFIYRYIMENPEQNI
ncbi:MAG: hypothetical protein KAS32_01690 [Candidatus Peribacteraceae bacterium]|nr:hypothetical protein [Candidatus Peribacteraceae bacterium]